jgi:biotin operon repressor
LQSLRLQDEQIISVPPDLPKLPNLPWRDRYLLYSLLLHERLTLEELAESLGENSHVMRTYVQELRLAGLIQGNFKALEVNPLYYAQLRLELAQNNFSITGDN